MNAQCYIRQRPPSPSPSPPPPSPMPPSPSPLPSSPSPPPPTVSPLAYSPARGCDRELNAWCEAECGPHTPGSEPFFARLDNRWRCYAKSALTADLMHSNGDYKYCTRHNQLLGLLAACSLPSPPPPPSQPPLSLVRPTMDWKWPSEYSVDCKD